MKEFHYKAISPNGELVVGIRRARDSDSLGQQLFAQNLTLLKTRQTLGSLGLAFSFAGRAGKKDLRDFTIHCAMCLGAGIPMLTALKDYETESAKGAFKDIISDIREEISSGAQVDEAFAKHPEVFSEIYIAMLSAGQQSGNLDESFEELISHIEWNDDLNSQSRQAMVYPAILMSGVLGLFLLMMLYVIPRFMGVFSEQDFELPTLTVKVMSAGDMFGTWWPFMLGGGIALYAGITAARRTERGRYITDLVWLKTPVVGGFAHKLALSRFSRQFSLLFASGVDLLRVLKLLQRVVGNAAMARELSMVHDRVTGGETLTGSFALTKHFPPLVTRLISVGEKSGSLDSTVVKAAEYYDKELPRALKQAFTVLEAIIIAVLGGLVVLFALALLMPIFEMRSQIM
ncbi:MAG: type II secretion system F family protein [bacterium]